MKTYTGKTKILNAVLVATLLAAPTAFAVVNSGSTGADGVFNPTVNTVLDVPPTGIFNFTSVNIPTGVTVTFKRNTTNTPVVILATGDVTVAGTINVNGANSTSVGAAGDGNIGDDGLPGRGGVGGYDGGRGGATNNGLGGTGLGPGGGGGGNFVSQFSANAPTGGGGGGFRNAGASSPARTTYGLTQATGLGGSAYGSSLLLPLIGGSGGGGGAGGSQFQGAGGGGGGGAILIASSGTVSVTGSVAANGAQSGGCAGQGTGVAGGGGSGGAVRIVATTISGNGGISAVGGGGRACGIVAYDESGAGASGYIRLEAETFLRTAASNPAHTFGTPGPIFIAGLPSLRITSVAGVNAPAAPTGNADITLPASTVNPVTVTVATTGVPVGNTVALTVTPANATPVTVVSPALTGTTDAATASVSVTLPAGPSTLQAVTTYTIVASLGDTLGNQFAKGERVQKIEVAAALNGGPSSVTLITVSGKRIPMAAPLPALAG